MKIFLTNLAGIPAYRQIENQIKQQIISGDIAENEMLPSIRQLAKQLGVGVITAKRAYDDLSAEGFVYSVQGKGVFAAKVEAGEKLKSCETELKNAIKNVVSRAEENGLPPERIRQIINQSLEEYDGRGNKNN